jgi:uncharacterized protein
VSVQAHFLGQVKTSGMHCVHLRSMTPIRFSTPTLQLFGVHHPSPNSFEKKGAVLLCNPWGQEAVRTHRMLRVLAERLCREGWHVLRFDYFGTGDSDGDDAQGHMSQWRADVVQAHLELQRRAFGAPVTWVGIRLGATLACQAAHLVEVKPAHVLLWEPVVDGPAYLNELARAHPRALQASFGVVPGVHQMRQPHEMLGFEMGEALRAELAQLRVDTLAQPDQTRVTLMAPPHLCTTAKALAHHSVVFEHAFDWTSEEAINTALVPHEAVSQLFDTITSSTAQ